MTDSMLFDAFWDGRRTQPATFPTGEAFDAVRVAEHHGRAAAQRITTFGSHLGAIVADTDADQWLFIIAPGSDARWPPIAHHLEAGGHLTLPPPPPLTSEHAPLCWVPTGTPHGGPFTCALVLHTVLDLLHEEISHRRAPP